MVRDREASARRPEDVNTFAELVFVLGSVIALTQSARDSPLIARSLDSDDNTRVTKYYHAKRNPVRDTDFRYYLDQASH